MNQKKFYKRMKSSFQNFKTSIIKNLSIDDIDRNILRITSKWSYNNKFIVTTIKMLMNQISLKKLDFYHSSSSISNTSFTTYPGAMNSLRNLSELSCRSTIYNYELYHQLSQICHKIQSLNITFEYISKGLLDLISVLKTLSIISFDCIDLDLTKIISLKNFRK